MSEIYERSLAVKEKALGPDHPGVAVSLNNLGNVSDAEGKFDQARAHIERALAIFEKALGPEHPEIAVSLNNLGKWRTRRGTTRKHGRTTNEP